MDTFLIFSDAGGTLALVARMAVVQTISSGKTLTPQKADLLVPDRAGQTVVPGSLGGDGETGVTGAISWLKDVSAIDVSQASTLEKYGVEGVHVQTVTSSSDTALTLNVFELSSTGLRTLASDANRNIGAGIVRDKAVARFDNIAFSDAMAQVGAASLKSAEISSRIKDEGWGGKSARQLDTYPDELARKVVENMTEPAPEMSHALIKAEEILKQPPPEDGSN